MRKKLSKNQGKAGNTGAEAKRNGIVGVIGSIPFASTTFHKKLNLETLELHGDWEILPAAKMVNGVPYVYRVIRKKLTKRFEEGLKSRKSRKSA